MELGTTSASDPQFSPNPRNRSLLIRSRMRSVVLFVLLLLVALVAYFESDAARFSIANPGNPFAAQLPPAVAAPPLTERVVLVLQDGLRDDLARSLPTISELARRSDSAFHRALTGVPSLSTPGRVALLCGTGPDVSGITLNESRGTVDVECLFQTVAAVGKESVAVGVRPSFARRYQTPSTRIIEARPEPFEHAPAEDPLRFDPALEALDYPSAFVYIDLVDYDSNAHEHGAFSPQALEAAARFDDFVRRLASRMDFSRETLIVTSDHGHIDAGGHGGYELLSRQSPLLMIGSGIGGGSTTDVSQIDIAPTIAALIGVPRPRDSRGDPIMDSLRGPAETLLEIDRTQNAALVRRLEAEFAYITNGPAPSGTPEVLRSEIEAVRWRRGVSEALRRIPLATGILIIVGVLAYLANGIERPQLLAALAVTGCVFLALLMVGFRGSISFFNTPADESLFFLAVCSGLGVGVLIGGVSVGLGDDSGKGQTTAARLALGFLSAIFLAMGTILAVYVIWYGSRYTWRMPDLRAALVAAVAMIVPFIAILCLPLAWLGVGIGRSIRARLSATEL